mmetsp:Transcript_93186/g.285185  ORF Transcript_93186/g.285185 Transcript_93186/m.285185 type:complete len:259 (+) Transcript_93186:183-959(+)
MKPCPEDKPAPATPGMSVDATVKGLYRRSSTRPKPEPFGEYTSTTSYEGVSSPRGLGRNAFVASSANSCRFCGSVASPTKPDATAAMSSPGRGPARSARWGGDVRRSSATSGNCLRKACSPSKSARAMVPVGHSRSIASTWPSLNPLSAMAPAARPRSCKTTPGFSRTLRRFRKRVVGLASTSSNALSRRRCQPIACRTVLGRATCRRPAATAPPAPTRSTRRLPTKRSCDRGRPTGGNAITTMATASSKAWPPRREG